VTITRSTGKPSSKVSKVRSQFARMVLSEIPQSTIVQPATPSISSRKTQRLM